MVPDGDMRPLLTVQDIADRYQIPTSTIYTWRTTGYGPKGFRVGKFLRYRLSDVEAWEQEQVDNSTD